MITNQQAMTLGHGKTLYHVNKKNADGTAVRCRVNGRCKTWKTRPNDFSLPVKHGLRECFYITPGNANEWLVMEPADESPPEPSREEVEETEAREFFGRFSQWVNRMGRHSEQVIEMMVNDHPTMQQNYMRFFLNFCHAMAKNEYTDLRNEGSVSLAKRVVELKDVRLPWYRVFRKVVSR